MNKTTNQPQDSHTTPKDSKPSQSAAQSDFSATDSLHSAESATESSAESTPSHAFSAQLKTRFLADKARFLTAFALIGVLVVVLAIDSPLLTCFIIALLSLVGASEALELYGLDSKPHYFIAVCAAWVLAYFNDRAIESALFVLLFYASYLAYAKSLQPKALLVFIYPLLPFMCLYALYKDAGGAGIWVIVWLIVIVAFTDTGAYFGGKAFGRTPFCATSPKKTLEGVICGVVCGVIFGSLVGIGTCGSFLTSLWITALVSIASVFGDLFESYLKREAGVKDSGCLLPGHGGVLDRLDAVLFGAVAMHFLLFFLPGYKTIGISL